MDEADIFARLKAQDENASMEEDQEIQDQLDEIERQQRGESSGSASIEKPKQPEPAEDVGKFKEPGQQVRSDTLVLPSDKNGREKNFEDLLDDSIDGVIVHGDEEIFDFEPPEAVI